MTSGDPSGGAAPIPRPVLAWGLAGLIPFLGLPILSLAAPELSFWCDRALGLYAAVILSFLGGARWGREVASAALDARVIALSMAPSVVAWGLVLAPATQGGLQLAGLAGALALSWLWDVRSSDLPAWYPRLRTLLTVGAVAGLALGLLLA